MHHCWTLSNVSIAKDYFKGAPLLLLKWVGGAEMKPVSRRLGKEEGQELQLGSEGFRGRS